MENTAKKTRSGHGCLGATLIIGILVVLLLVLTPFAYFSYNGLVSREEGVTAQWAQVENVYQRRMDLIENLVSTVKGYATHENKTLTEVIEARSKATQVKISADNLSESNIEQFQKAQDGLGSTLSRLLVVAESYPNLKANENFMALQGQLEQTENQITAERAKFNTSAQDYNTYRRKFPKNLFAWMFGFDPKGYFKAEPGANKAPKVVF